jgi:hypothetical protein
MVYFEISVVLMAKSITNDDTQQDAHNDVDSKLFPLFSSRGLHSHATTAASRSRVGSFVGNKK